MDDIINYTMKTPDNTNPNVLRGMLENYNKSDGGSSMFYVNIDPSGVNPTADKTFEEIKSAYNSGKNVVANVQGRMLFPLCEIEFDNEENVIAFNFTSVTVTSDRVTQKGTLYFLRISIDSHVVGIDEQSYEIDKAT